ncbi:hypothetical protein YC2023_041212 [Brassica napus]
MQGSQSLFVRPAAFCFCRRPEEERLAMEDCRKVLQADIQRVAKRIFKQRTTELISRMYP